MVIKINKNIYMNLFQEPIIFIAFVRFGLEYIPSTERNITCINWIIKTNTFFIQDIYQVLTIEKTFF